MSVMKILWLFVGLLGLSAGVAQFSAEDDDILISWDIQTDGTVMFAITVTNDFHDAHDWWGFGLNEDSDEMPGADLWVIFESSATDRVGITNGMPPLDTSNGGTSDIYSIMHTHVDDAHIISFYRELDTGDSNDVKLVEGKSYYLIWAYGKASGSTLLEHDSSDSGSADIDFTNDFNNDDSSSAFYFTGAFALLCASLQLGY